METYDAIVVGVGGMGSAAVCHLARRGARVLGIEQYDIPHDQGSSHGISRIIRLAYFEHPAYVPLLQRAYTLWWTLEHEVDERLLWITGSLDIGTETGSVFQGALAAARQHHLDHEVMDARNVQRRFPGYGISPPLVGLYQPQGGLLASERCIVAHVTAALKSGAEVHGRETVQSWQPHGHGIDVYTNRNTYRARHLVLTAGAWLPALLARYDTYMQPERQVLIWLQPQAPEDFYPARFPVFNMEVEEGKFYGFPTFGIPGFKFARWHHLHQAVDDPTHMDRHCHPEDETLLKMFVQRYFPRGDGPILSMRTCLFTNTPDEHFIVDTHPDDPQVTVAGGFSGHGYKFCSVMGEILADLTEQGTTRHDISLFSLRRFGSAHASHA